MKAQAKVSTDMAKAHAQTVRAFINQQTKRQAAAPAAPAAPAQVPSVTTIEPPGGSAPVAPVGRPLRIGDALHTQQAVDMILRGMKPS